MKMNILPATVLGKWSLGLIMAMPVLFLIGTSLTNSLYDTVSAGDTILEDVVKRPALALTMLAGFASGIAAFFTGLVAVAKAKERAVSVFVSTLIGFLIVLFIAAEIAFPH